MEELDHFLNNSRETQKILSVQYGVPLNESEMQSLMVGPNITDMTIKEDIPEVVPNPTQSTTLSADKLLETAIKDTCILSEQESDGSDSMDAMTDEQSASDEKVSSQTWWISYYRLTVMNDYRMLLVKEPDYHSMQENQSHHCLGKGKSWLSP